MVYTNKVRPHEGEKRERREMIAEAPLGSIVAAEFPDGKLRSGKIRLKNEALQVLVVETSYGWSEIIGYGSIQWVKRYPDDPWPSGVLQRMKRNERTKTTKKPACGVWRQSW